MVVLSPGIGGNQAVPWGTGSRFVWRRARVTHPQNQDGLAGR